MQVTDEMIETACAHHWPGPWPGDRSEKVLAIRREDMRSALTAALSDQERAVEVKPLTKTQIETLANNIHNVNEYAYTVECLTYHLGGSALVDVPVEPVAWRTMETAPTDGTDFIAAERWESSGKVRVRVYRYEGHPNYWHCREDGVCIRPEYQHRFLWISIPTALAATRSASATNPEGVFE